MSEFWYDNLNEKGKEYFSKTLAAGEHMTWEKDITFIEDILFTEEFKYYCKLMAEIWKDIRKEEEEQA